MGRPKIYKTEAQQLRARDQAKRRHNVLRRKRYRTDPVYREEITKANLDKYREMVGMEFRKAEPNMVSIVATQEDVFEEATGKSIGRKMCVDYDNMAILLGGYHKFVLHRWHRTERFPRAKHYIVEDSHRRSVYLSQDAKKLAILLRDHQATKQYLSRRDVNIIRSLFSIMG